MKNEIEILDKLSQLKAERESLDSSLLEMQSIDQGAVNKVHTSLHGLDCGIYICEWILEDEFFGVDL